MWFGSRGTGNAARRRSSGRILQAEACCYISAPDWLRPSSPQGHGPASILARATYLLIYFPAVSVSGPNTTLAGVP
jgi:hypothetical protein